jgi:hypothetical protein
MNPLIQDAPSLIRSSQQILLVRVTDAKKVETSPGASAVDRVISDVTLQVERVVKGTVSASPPFEVTLPIEQHVRTVSRVFAVPGVWSPFELSPGARYVVFSSSPSEDPVTVLDQQNTLGVRKADEAEFDVTVAAAAEAEHLTVDALISRVMPRAASVGVLLAEYIASYQSSVLFDDFDSFSAMLELLEAPELGLQPRSVLFESLQVNLADSETAPDRYVEAMARTAFRIMVLETAAGMRENMVEQDLPLLLGLSERPTRVSARDVFRGTGDLRAEVGRTLDSYPDPGAVAPLKRWMD